MKIILTLAALVGVTSISSGQGNANFANGVNSSSHIYTNATPGGPATGRISGSVDTPSPFGYYFALFVAPTTVTTATTPLNPIADGFTLVNAIGTNTALGRFSGNPDSNDVIIPGYGIGSTAAFVIVGWSANMGASWSAFQNNRTTGPTDGSGYYYAGESAVATSIILGGGLTPAGPIFGPQPGQMEGFTLQFTQIPEPTICQITAPAIVALTVWCRRRKN